MPTTVVTGGAGFLGSHLCERLLAAGHKVWCLDNLDTGSLTNIAHLRDDNFSFVQHDVTTHIEIPGDVDFVFHFASPASPIDYLRLPLQTLKVGSYGTHNALGLAKAKRARFLTASTSEVYGTAQFVPITEAHPLRGQSPYSASKISADQIAMSYHASFGTPVAVVRPFNTYGPRQSARAVIPTIITQIAQGQREIKLGSVHPTRDFSHVNDTVRGFLAAHDSAAAVGEVINLGSNFEISVGEAARTIADVMGVEVEIVTDDERLRPAGSEVERLWADNSKAKDLLGWEPLYGGYAGFRRGLAETIDWFADPRNLAKYKWDRYNI
jgi:dTDP-glucose 4,6-dehydratase